MKIIILNKQIDTNKERQNFAMPNFMPSVKTIVLNKKERYKWQAEFCTAECLGINENNLIKQERKVHAKIGRGSWF